MSNAKALAFREALALASAAGAHVGRHPLLRGAEETPPSSKLPIRLAGALAEAIGVKPHWAAQRLHLEEWQASTATLPEVQGSQAERLEALQSLLRLGHINEALLWRALEANGLEALVT